MIRIENIISEFKEYTKDQVDTAPIQIAYILAAKTQSYFKILGSSYLEYAMETAKVLINLRLDIQSIIAGLLHGILVEGKISLEEIQSAMGNETANVVLGVHSINTIADTTLQDEDVVENMRQMVFATSKDMRILFVNLAVRLVQMRHLSRLFSTSAKKIAQATLDTYSPIAERLGLSHIKVELEDLCFSYIKSHEHKKIAQFLEENREKHQASIDRLTDEIQQLMVGKNIDGYMKGRIKHRYSLFLKSVRYGVDYKHLHDLLGLRIIVNSESECYEVLGLISSHYKSISGTYKDYISFPKPNGYQSLHTQVVGNLGQSFEIQIRTNEMNSVAVRGIAAHWEYKANIQVTAQEDEKTVWLQELGNSLNITSDPKESLEIFTRELYSDFVYAFSPKGKIVKLPKNATLLDFAYAIHSEIGNTCVSAQINGKNRPLHTVVKHGDKITVLTLESQQPQMEWLNIATTSKALSYIKTFLRKREKKQSIKLGREMFSDFLYKHKSDIELVESSEKMKTFITQHQLKSVETFYSQIGFGTLDLSIFNLFITGEEKTSQKGNLIRRTLVKPFKRKAPESVEIAGLNDTDMIMHYAKCCLPVKGDEIIGAVTPGKGISIHLVDCINIRSQIINPSKLIQVEWSKNMTEKLPVRINLQFDNKIKTTLNITKILAGYDIELLQNNLRLINNVTHQDITMRVTDADQLIKILRKLNNIKSVKAERTQEAEYIKKKENNKS